MKLCFSTLGCPDWDVWQIAEKAREYGFDAVELRVKDDKHIDPVLTKEERQKIREHYKNNNVEIACLSGYTSWNRDDTELLENSKRKMLANIDLACDLGTKYIRTFIGGYPPEIPDETIDRVASQYLNECGGVAEAKGVQILIETHDKFGTAKKVNRILKNIQNNGVAVLWDMRHSLLEGESMEETYALLGDKIKHLHIKDAKQKEDGKYESCLLGQGILPVDDMIAFMKGKSFAGCYSLEWEKMWEPELEGPEIAFPHYVKYMRAL